MFSYSLKRHYPLNLEHSTSRHSNYTESLFQRTIALIRIMIINNFLQIELLLLLVVRYLLYLSLMVCKVSDRMLRCLSSDCLFLSLLCVVQRGLRRRRRRIHRAWCIHLYMIEMLIECRGQKWFQIVKSIQWISIK